MTRPSVKQPICRVEMYTNTGGGEETSDDFFAGLASLPDDVYRSVTACLVRIAKRVGVPADECEDVAQEVWLEAAEQLGRFRGEHELRRLCSWLFSSRRTTVCWMPDANSSEGRCSRWMPWRRSR